MLLRDRHGTYMFVSTDDARAIDNMLEAVPPVVTMIARLEGYCEVHEPTYAPLLRCGKRLPCDEHGAPA